MVNRTREYWGGDRYYATIMSIAGINFNLHLSGIDNSFDMVTSDFDLRWLEKYCSPLTKLEKVLS